MSTLEKSDLGIEARLVEMFVEGHTAGNKDLLPRLLLKNEANQFPFKKELFPSHKFSKICSFVKDESLKILTASTSEERDAFIFGNGGPFKPELTEKLRPLFLKRVAAFIFNEGTMELNPLFQDLFDQANRERVEAGKEPLLLTKELKLDLFERYCLLCGNAVLKELDSVIAQSSTDANPYGSLLRMSIITGITGNENNIEIESQKFFDSLDNNKEDDADLQASPTSTQLLEDAIEKFKDILEDDKTTLANPSDSASIYTAGKQLLVAAGEAAESANTEETAALATVVNYGTKQLQHLVEPTVQSSSALPSKAQKCSDEEYQDAKMKLQGKYDEVVSSATKFLEAVATVIVKGIFLAIAAIASSGSSLVSSVPLFVLYVDPFLSPTDSRGHTENARRNSNRGFFDASKQPPQARDESKLTPLPQLLLSK